MYSTTIISKCPIISKYFYCSPKVICEDISATILETSAPPNATSKISCELINKVSLYSIESTSTTLNSMKSSPTNSNLPYSLPDTLPQKVSLVE